MSSNALITDPVVRGILRSRVAVAAAESEQQMSFCTVCRSTVSMLIGCSSMNATYYCCDGYEATGGSSCMRYLDLVPQIEAADRMVSINAMNAIIPYLRVLCLANMARLSDSSAIEFMRGCQLRLLTLKRNVAALFDGIDVKKRDINFHWIVDQFGKLTSSTLPADIAKSDVGLPVIESIYSRLAIVQQSGNSGVPPTINVLPVILDKSLVKLNEPVAAETIEKYSVEEQDHLKVRLHYYYTILGRQWPFVARCVYFASVEKDVVSDILQLERLREMLLQSLGLDYRFFDDLNEQYEDGKAALAEPKLPKTDLELGPQQINGDGHNVTMIEENRPGEGDVMAVATSAVPAFEPPKKQYKCNETNYPLLQIVRERSCLETLNLVSDDTILSGSFCHKKKDPRDKAKKGNHGNDTTSLVQKFWSLLSSPVGPITHSHMEITCSSADGLRVSWVIIEASNLSAAMKSLKISDVMSAKMEEFLNAKPGASASEQATPPTVDTASTSSSAIKKFALFLVISVRVNKNEMVTGIFSIESRCVAPTEGGYLALFTRDSRLTQPWALANLQASDGKHMFTVDPARRNVRFTAGNVPHHIVSGNIKVKNGKSAVIEEVKFAVGDSTHLSGCVSHTILVPAKYCSVDALVNPTKLCDTNRTIHPTIVGVMKENNFFVHETSPAFELLLCNAFVRPPVCHGDPPGKAVFTARAKVPDCIEYLYYMRVGEGDHPLTTRKLRVIQLE